MSAGLQRRRLVCARCGKGYIHTNRMERRALGWDHTLACARARGEMPK